MVENTAAAEPSRLLRAAPAITAMTNAAAVPIQNDFIFRVLPKDRVLARAGLVTYDINMALQTSRFKVSRSLIMVETLSAW